METRICKVCQCEMNDDESGEICGVCIEEEIEFGIHDYGDCDDVFHHD